MLIMKETKYCWEPSPHTADLAIKIKASDKTLLFFAAFDGLLETLGLDRTPPNKKYIIECGVNLPEAEIEESLVDFLNECIYLMDAEDLVPFRIKTVKQEDNEIVAEIQCRGIKESDKGLLGHIKAATYSDLSVKEIDGNFEATIVFDT
jgi:SHS2 domain-containing protein